MHGASMNTLMLELMKTMFQLILIGIVGGGVGFFYSQLQKNRELRISTLQRVADLHGRFLALRYEYNSFFIQWGRRELIANQRLSTEEIGRHKWLCYEQACQLVGEFQSLKPLVSALFPGDEQTLDEIYSIYQEWRRQSGADVPILQDENGKSADRFKALRTRYEELIGSLQRKI